MSQTQSIQYCDLFIKYSWKDHPIWQILPKEIFFLNTKKDLPGCTILNENICGVWYPPPPLKNLLYRSCFTRWKNLHSRFFHIYFTWQPIRYCELKAWGSKDTGFNFHQIVYCDPCHVTYNFSLFLYPWKGAYTDLCCYKSWSKA